MSKDVVAFIGLGVMGYPMAGHLANKGYSVVVYNRSDSKSKRWQKEFGGKVATSPSDAAKDARFVCICVGNDDDVSDVVFSEKGVLNTLARGGILIDHTTASSKIANEVGTKAKQKGIGFLDAPVSGGGIGAQKGTLSVMVGGDSTDFEKALPVMKCYGASINLMGPIGSGQLTKMVNQICIVGALQGVAEAMNFGNKAGLDMEKVLSVISKGAAQSWQLENRGPWMLNEQYKNGGFAVNLIEKDLTLVLEEATRSKSKLPVASQVHEFFKKLQKQNKGLWDFSSLIDLLED